MNSIFKFLGKSLVAIATLSAAAAQANLLSNGSFEAPVTLPDSGYCFVNGGGCGPVEGWDGTFQIATSDNSAWSGPSGLPNWQNQMGSQLAILQNTASLHQMLNLSAGEYELRWSDAGRLHYGSELYGVSYAGNVMAMQSTGGGQGWVEHVVRFHANGAGLLSFNSIRVAGTDAAAFIDNVQLTAVPEPASAALLGLGLAGVAATRRRSQRG